MLHQFKSPRTPVVGKAGFNENYCLEMQLSKSPSGGFRGLLERCPESRGGGADLSKIIFDF